VSACECSEVSYSGRDRRRVRESTTSQQRDDQRAAQIKAQSANQRVLQPRDPARQSSVLESSQTRLSMTTTASSARDFDDKVVCCAHPSRLAFGWPSCARLTSDRRIGSNWCTDRPRKSNRVDLLPGAIAMPFQHRQRHHVALRPALQP
jgi:hypothetical protein